MARTSLFRRMFEPNGTKNNGAESDRSTVALEMHHQRVG